MGFLLQALIITIAGVALSFAQAPYDLWPLIFPCFGVFYYLYASLERKRTVFLLSFLFSLGYFIVGLYWIGNALLVEGNEYKWAWPLAVVALPTLLSLFPALYLTINFILFKHNAFAKFIGFCLFLSFSEWVRGYVFTGFPWNLYGYTVASDLKIAQSLSVIGPYGLTLLAIIWGASMGYEGKHKRFIWIASIISILALSVYGHVRLSQNPTAYNKDYQFHLIQPNIAQAEKWEDEFLARNFESHFALSNRQRKKGGDKDKKHIYVWPETAIPPILLNDPARNNRLQQMLGDDAILLSGTLNAEMGKDAFDAKYYNGLSMWGQGNFGTRLYAKSHLVPFGEYIPFQQFIPLETVTQFSGFNRGQGAQTIKVENYPSFTPLICYEVIFPHKAVNKAQERPDYILTVTNDGWYGDSAGPRQHFRQARFRAIEQAIPVIRNANTGISGTIDAYGRSVMKSDLLKRQTVQSWLPLKSQKATLYSRFGDLPYLIICLIILAFLLHRKTRKS